MCFVSSTGNPIAITAVDLKHKVLRTKPNTSSRSQVCWVQRTSERGSRESTSWWATASTTPTWSSIVYSRLVQVHWTQVTPESECLTCLIGRCSLKMVQAVPVTSSGSGSIYSQLFISSDNDRGLLLTHLQKVSLCLTSINGHTSILMQFLLIHSHLSTIMPLMEGQYFLLPFQIKTPSVSFFF